MSKSALETKLEIMAVAKLCSEGFNQIQTARKLSLTQPRVCRLLKIAKEKGWLKDATPIFDPKGDFQLWKMAEAKFFSAQDILAKLRAISIERKSTLRTVHLFDRDGGESFGPAIAHIMQNIFKRANIVGITWGLIMSRMVAALRSHLASPVHRNSPIRFVPLCGEPLKNRENFLPDSSASTLAAELDLIVNGARQQPLISLSGVPCFVPLKFSNDQFLVIRRFLSEVSGYNEIFQIRGEKLKLQHPIDTIITSPGIVQSDYQSVFLQEHVLLNDLTRDELASWVLGDIGGIIIARESASRNGHKRVKELNDRWMGISLNESKKIARFANINDFPGVVLIAVGKNKLAIVKHCVRNNLINELIIDRELMASLLSD